MSTAKKKWLAFATIIFIVQIALETFAAYQMMRTNILPHKYTFVILAGEVIMVLLTAIFLFTMGAREAGAAKVIGRILGIIFAIAAIGVSIYATVLFMKASQTVNEITNTDKRVEAVVGVYVMNEDPAQTIEDAADYTFGIMTDYDQEHTEDAVSHISDHLGKEIATEGSPSVFETAEALYNGEVGAVIVNKAYVDLLDDNEADTGAEKTFSDRTRLLYEVTFEVDMSTETVDPEEEQAAANRKKLGTVSERPFIMYISGSDTTGYLLESTRSDVNILVVVNPVTKQILLLNTPRDFYVENPAGNGALDKLTHCGIYGISNSVAALSWLYDADIEYYAQINFTGFETLIDAIGGVTVYSEYEFSAKDYTYYVGYNDMDGAKALVFARERHSFAGGDRVRGQNQMRVINAVIQKISSDGVALLTNYSQIMNSIQGMFKTNMTSSDIEALIKLQLNEMPSWNVVSYAVTGSDGSATTYTTPGAYAYVMIRDESTVEKAKELINMVLDGETITSEDAMAD
ncbi:MAG: LCP family protein [Lachnospiraceae bacterium]|nr:LCP family protein [Lachnospiraceae bacterium]